MIQNSSFPCLKFCNGVDKSWFIAGRTKPPDLRTWRAKPDIDQLLSISCPGIQSKTNSEAAKQFMEELERGSGEGGGGESSQDRSQMVDGQIVTDSDEEDGKELFDSVALAALLKVAADGGSEGGNITFSSQDSSRLFTVERPAGLGPSFQTM
ncbi:hypothetical protein L2E82_20116 [Cichorium intybus]|uniref:Uncharacterized protein n=1 Tax=Cichorium intybus TaxID=13427 RepID=A0ACB9DT86_CICIN|nr:hypothetical protein L2E82_20116 [Cichorium intybus]